jgi:hypothetical protein
MSTGYLDMCPHDFDSYMMGCYVFRYHPEEQQVTAWQHGGIYDYDDEDDGDARECSCMLTRIGAHDQVCMNIGELFDSPNWVVHRFPIGYIAIMGGTKLVRLASEPYERRMRKGTNFDYVRGQDIVSTCEQMIPPAVQSMLSSYAFNALSHSSCMWNVLLLEGLCEQLALGNDRPFHNSVPRNLSRTRSRAMVRDVLDPTNERTVAALSPEVAVVGSKRGKRAVVLYNGRILGTLRPTGSKVVLESDYHLSFEKGAIRNTVMASVETTIMPMVCNQTIWSTKKAS